MDLGGAFRRVGEVAQNGCDPFDQKCAAGIVRGPVDRPAGLRIGAGKIEREPVAFFDQRQRKLVQFRVGDAVVLDIVLPGVFAVGDLRQQLASEDIAASVEDRLEAGFHRLAAEALKQLRHAARAHEAGLHLAVEIGGQRFGDAGVALDHGEHRVVARARVVEFDRRNSETLLEYRGRRAGHRAGHAAADVVVMTERLDVGDDSALMKHRHGRAQVGEVADRSLGQVGIVHQKYVAGPHRVRWKIAHYGIRHGGVGAAGELAAVAIEQADAVIVGFADHRRARGALDCVFDFGLDGIERPFDDLQNDRIDRARRQIRCGRPRPLPGMHVYHRFASAALPVARTIRMPCGSTVRCWPGNTTVVEPNSSTTAGPSSRKPAVSTGRAKTGVSRNAPSK